MSTKIYLVQGDSGRPQVKATISDANTEAVVDVSNASVLLKFRKVGDTVLADTITGVVTDGPNGVVVFPMSATAMAGEPGDYEGEIEVTFASGGGIQTVYDILKFRLRGQF